MSAGVAFAAAVFAAVVLPRKATADEPAVVADRAEEAEMMPSPVLVTSVD